MNKHLIARVIATAAAMVGLLAGARVSTARMIVEPVRCPAVTAPVGDTVVAIPCARPAGAALHSHLNRK